MTEETNITPSNRGEHDNFLPNIDDPEVLEAFRYMVLKENGWKEAQIADDLGITRQALWSRRQTWKKNGSLEKAGQLILDPLLSDVESTNRIALAFRHQIIKRVIDIALGQHGASARTQLEAAAWLEDTVYKPLTELQEQSGAAEMSYAKNTKTLKPTLITKPDFLAKKKVSGEE